MFTNTNIKIYGLIIPIPISVVIKNKGIIVDVDVSSRLNLTDFLSIQKSFSVYSSSIQCDRFDSTKSVN